MSDNLSEIPVVWRTVFKSSHVLSTGYNAEKMVLAVVYTDASEYRWRSIPDDVYAEICAAESVGKYLHAMTKKFGKGIRVN